MQRLLPEVCAAYVAMPDKTTALYGQLIRRFFYLMGLKEEKNMDFLTSDIKKLYRKYLFASLGSALVTSIYSFVDTIAVGQSVGPLGTAAMATINPFYGIMTFMAILCGIGGSVLMSSAKGEGKEEKGNAYFTASLILAVIVILIGWSAFFLFHESIFTFFGADETTMPYVMQYAQWLIRFFPLFTISIFLGAFVRNDGAPGLAMAAVITGGIVNVFGDWYLCFPLNMGMNGAAIATVSGTAVQVVLLCSHFFRRGCGLKIVRPFRLFTAIRKILAIGFGSSILDLGTVVLAVIINNQITRYGSIAALSVYGAVGTISSLVQALFCGVGQAIQPLVSSNYGAKQKDRIRTVFRMSLSTVLIMGVIFTGIGELFPTQITNLFIAATPEVLSVAPFVIRTYFPLFLFLGITVLATYYLQSVMQGGMSMVISVLRSIVLSSLLLFILPVFFNLAGVFVAMPISELIVAVIGLWYIRKIS